MTFFSKFGDSSLESVIEHINKNLNVHQITAYVNTTNYKFESRYRILLRKLKSQIPTVMVDIQNNLTSDKYWLEKSQKTLTPTTLNVIITDKYNNGDFLEKVFNFVLINTRAYVTSPNFFLSSYATITVPQIY